MAILVQGGCAEFDVREPGPASLTNQAALDTGGTPQTPYSQVEFVIVSCAEDQA
jgi:hypothetical protein